MKILIIPSWYPRSDNTSGSFFHDRAKALSKKGCDVTVAVAELSFIKRGRSSAITSEYLDGVRIIRYFKRNITPFSKSGISVQKIGMIRSIYSQLVQENWKPDLIHLESALDARAAVSLAKEESIALTYTEHSSKILASKKGDYYDKMMKQAVNNADHIFVISYAIKQRLEPPEGKWSMLPNETDFSKFTLADQTMDFVFKTLGTLRKVKGYDILIRAFKMVKDRQYENCRLVIGGSGEEEHNLKQLAIDLNLESHVKFPGYIEASEKNNFFDNVSCFVCSSRIETFSIVTVEALACGIPVVATRCGGPEDIVNDSNGYLVEKENALALANGMIRMMYTRDCFDSQSIRSQAKLLYDKDVVIDRQIEVFSHLVI
ncbi:MAG TPA: glycosyltransferase [Candidatus Eisenbacteria bacterium]|nr:glycosyltransferase [Candidatus Eisenbacteria bacterium]